VKRGASVATLRKLQLQLLECIEAGTHGEVERAKLVRLKRVINVLIPPDPSTLRVDLMIRDKRSRNEWWIDVAVVHPTGASYLAREMKGTLATIADRCDAKQSPRSRRRCGPTVAARMLEKTKKYAPLMRVAADQARLGVRKYKLHFVPAIMSSYTEVSVPLHNLCRQLEYAYGRQMDALQPRDDGKTTKTLMSEFRARLRVELALTCIVGTTRVLRAAIAGRYTRFYHPLNQ